MNETLEGMLKGLLIGALFGGFVLLCIYLATGGLATAAIIAAMVTSSAGGALAKPFADMIFKCIGWVSKYDGDRVTGNDTPYKKNTVVPIVEAEQNIPLDWQSNRSEHQEVNNQIPQKNSSNNEFNIFQQQGCTQQQMQQNEDSFNNGNNGDNKSKKSSVTFAKKPESIINFGKHADEEQGDQNSLVNFEQYADDEQGDNKNQETLGTLKRDVPVRTIFTINNDSDYYKGVIEERRQSANSSGNIGRNSQQG